MFFIAPRNVRLIVRIFRLFHYLGEDDQTWVIEHLREYRHSGLPLSFSHRLNRLRWKLAKREESYDWTAEGKGKDGEG